MNLIQIIRKARLGADAILPGSQVSSLWGDDEMADLVQEANEEINLRFQKMHVKWGLQTVSQTDSPFVRDGEIYTPATSLHIAGQVGTSGPARIALPPDFGEMVRVLCISDRTVRFQPAPVEWGHWINLEQGSYGLSGVGTVPQTPSGMTFYYDILANRTMIVIPPVTQSYDIAIDYIPMKAPLQYTTTGTIAVTNGLTSIVGTGTKFQTDGLFSEASNQACELIVGVNDPQDSTILLRSQYPRVAQITSDTAAVLVSAWGGTTQATANFIMTMAPTVKRDYHRWIARLVTSLMLAKVSPQLSSDYSQGVFQRFTEVVEPTARIRQSQDSKVTEDAEEMGLQSDY
jgi:hypothetical protein